MNEKKLLEKLGIDLLIIIGVLMISMPLIKNSLVGIVTQNSVLVNKTQLPSDVETESIHPVQFEDIIKQAGQAADTYGSVEIESLGWGVPLLIGVTNANLAVGGVVLYPERTIENHNIVIAGHHLGISQLLFGPILEVKEGDQIDLNYRGEAASYFVTSLKEVDETDLTVLEDTDSTQLTLITCPSPQLSNKRFVVIAKLNSQVKKTKVNVELNVRQWQQSKKGFFISWLSLFLVLLVMIGLITIKHYISNKINDN